MQFSSISFITCPGHPPFVVNGNTKRIAEQLTNGTGADIARIETTEPYSGSHEDVVEQGKREVEAGFMPQINPISVNLAD